MEGERRFLWARSAPALGDSPQCGLKEGLLIQLPQRIIIARSRERGAELSGSDSSTLLLSGRAAWVGMSLEILRKPDDVLRHGAMASSELFARSPELQDSRSSSWPFGSSKL